MKARPRYYTTRIPAPNPTITDPVWPNDPFWRSKKYSRDLRAKIAHEWHHDPSQPTLHHLSIRHNVPVSSLTMWCFAYPFGKREMVRRNYSRHIQSNYFQNQEHIDRLLNSYTKELRDQFRKNDPTWSLMGDPLPSRSAKNAHIKSGIQPTITLPPVIIR